MTLSRLHVLSGRGESNKISVIGSIKSCVLHLRHGSGVICIRRIVHSFIRTVWRAAVKNQPAASLIDSFVLLHPMPGAALTAFINQSP